MGGFFWMGWRWYCFVLDRRRHVADDASALPMDNPFAPWLETGRTIVLDGGLGTELERRGHRDLGRLWSSALVTAAPEALREVHRDFIIAGADVIATATYQASMPTLNECGLDRQAAEKLLREAVRLAVECREEKKVLIAASVGPYATHLADGSEYTGAYHISFDDLLAFQRERWEILADTEADLIACETLPSRMDVAVFAHLFHETPRRAGWLSLMCRDSQHLADGTPLAEICALLNEVPNLAAIGVNCVPPKLAPALLDHLRSLTDKPLAVYPNASNSWDLRTRQPLDELAPAPFACDAVTWKQHGARLIGGCCRTTPEHIRLLRQACV